MAKMNPMDDLRGRLTEQPVQPMSEGDPKSAFMDLQKQKADMKEQAVTALYGDYEPDSPGMQDLEEAVMAAADMLGVPVEPFASTGSVPADAASVIAMLQKALNDANLDDLSLDNLKSELGIRRLSGEILDAVADRALIRYLKKEV